MFAQLASTNWLFNEGYYLHSRITVNIFNTSDAPIKFFHALGWGKFLRIIDKYFISLNKTKFVFQNYSHWRNQYLRFTDLKENHYNKKNSRY